MKTMEFRTMAFFKNLYGKDILPALHKALEESKDVPIYCIPKEDARKYTHGAKIDESLQIGVVHGFRYFGNKIFCDYTLNRAKALTKNFRGKLNNYALKLTQTNNGNRKLSFQRVFVYQEERRTTMNTETEACTNAEQEKEDVRVCMEIAGAESMPELHVDAPKAN